MAQICFNPCNGNWISVSWASDLLDVCLCWWSKLSECPFWSNEESITKADWDFSLAYYMKFFDHQTQVLKQAHWSTWSYVLCDSSASRLRSTIALVSKFLLCFYTFVSSLIHFHLNSKSLNGVHSSQCL